MHYNRRDFTVCDNVSLASVSSVSRAMIFITLSTSKLKFFSNEERILPPPPPNVIFCRHGNLYLEKDCVLIG